ncbi:hypothetical protein HDV01_005221 [Terramyces sp. JEL0728]|nr:hypothetical protein HDV01_005221 [Terramyces sp. JEL0728]
MKYLLIDLLIGTANAYIYFAQTHNDPSCTQSYSVDQLANLYYLTSVFKQTVTSNGNPGPVNGDIGNGPPPTPLAQRPPPLANGSPPPVKVSMGCYPSITNAGYFAYFLLDSQNTLSYYDKCTFGDCSTGCNLIASSPYTDNSASSANCLAQSYVPAVSLTKSYRQKFYNAGVSCNGTVVYYVDVPIYDSCTAVGSGYAISSMDGDTVTQSLCSDSACTSCKTSSSIKPWQFKKACSQVQDANGLPLFSTIGMMVVNGVEQTPVLNQTTPTSSASAAATSSSDSSSSGASVIIISVVVGSAIILLFAIALLSVFYFKKKSKSKLDKKFESVTMLPSEPTSVISGMDRGTYLMYLDSVDENAKHT